MTEETKEEVYLLPVKLKEKTKCFGCPCFQLHSQLVLYRCVAKDWHLNNPYDRPRGCPLELVLSAVRTKQ